MVLQVRAQFQAAGLRDRLAEDHAVGVANRHQPCPHPSGRGLDIDHSVVDRDRGQVRGQEGRRSDVQLAGDPRALLLQDIDRIAPVHGSDLKLIGCPVLEDGVAGRDPEPVAALLRLGGVGVVDPDRHRRRIEGQQPVGAEAEVTIADRGQKGDDRLHVGGKVDHQVVISERLVFDQLDGIVLGHVRLPRIVTMQPYWFAITWPAQRLLQKPACFCS